MLLSFVMPTTIGCCSVVGMTNPQGLPIESQSWCALQLLCKITMKMLG